MDARPVGKFHPWRRRARQVVELAVEVVSLRCDLSKELAVAEGNKQEKQQLGRGSGMESYCLNIFFNTSWGEFRLINDIFCYLRLISHIYTFFLHTRRVEDVF